MERIRALIIAKHPVYYTVPIFRAMAADERIDLKVLYLDDISLREVFHAEINAFFKPDQDLLSGYENSFVKNIGAYFKGVSRISFFSHLNPDAVTQVIRSRANYVLVHGYDKLTLWLVLLAARLSGKKVFFRGEVTDKLVPTVTRLGRAKEFIRNLLVRIYLANCQAVFFSCTGNKIHLSRFLRDERKLFAFPCAVDNRFHVEQYRLLINQRDKIRASFGMLENDTVIIFPARITERKRPLDLIEAVAKLNRSNLIILFVGDGPLCKNIESRADELKVRIKLTGHIQPNKMPIYYIAADIFTLLSDYDPSPKALNEAMNYRLPLIVSNVAGTAFDLVHEGHNGYIVKVGDINDISSKLEKLIDCPRLADMGNRSLEIVNAWSIDADIEGFLRAVKFIDKSE
jgi:glycosyltransferase involved in cell wall biosynthesis